MVARIHISASASSLHSNIDMCIILVGTGLLLLLHGITIMVLSSRCARTARGALFGVVWECADDAAMICCCWTMCGCAGVCADEAVMLVCDAGGVTYERSYCMGWRFCWVGAGW